MRRRMVVALWAAVLVAPMGPALADSARQVRFSLTAHNPTAGVLADQELWFYVPRDTARQQLEELRVNAPHRVVKDEVGNTIVAVTYDQLPPFATRIVNVTAELQLKDSPGIEPTRSAQRFLGPERLIQADHAEIRALAGQLRRDGPLETGHAIYEWVGANLQYAGFVADDLGALQAYKSRRGDCTEYAYLAAALARASGIPARVVGGYVTDRDLVLQPSAYHNWAEVFIDGAWQILDAQKGVWRDKAEQYIAFHVRGAVSESPMAGAHRFRVRGEMTVRMD